jgi:hypothetical protein
MKAPIALAAALLAATSLLTIASTGSATAPGENGRIAFHRFFNSNQT